MNPDAKEFLDELSSLKKEINQPILQQPIENQSKIYPNYEPGKPEEIIIKEPVVQKEDIEEIRKEVVKNVDDSEPEDLDIVDIALQTLNEDIVEKTTVYLPALKTEILLTPLTSIDELTMDTNRLTLKDFLHLLNGIILKHIEYPQELHGVFKSLKNFEKNILPIDKNIILHMLLNISFDKLTEFPMTCEKCGEEFIADALVKNTSVKFDLTPAKLKKVDFYNLIITQKLFNGKLELDLGFNPEWVKIFLLEKQGDENTKENLKKNVFFSLFTNLIQYVKEVRVKDKEGKLVAKFDSKTKTNINKLFNFFMKMPMKSKEILIDHVDLSVLDPYLPEFNLQIPCPKCHHIHTLPYQPETEFFRKALYYST